MSSKLGIKIYRAIALALVLALALPWAAFADTVDVSGDSVTATTTLDFGSSVCANTTVSKSVNVAVVRTGNVNNSYANSASVTVAVTSVTGSGLSAQVPSSNKTITLPSKWLSLSNNTKSGSVSSSVTLVAGNAGVFTGSVVYSLSGSGASGGTLTRTITLNVKATVVNCDTTGPVLTLPANIIAEATSASGAIVTFTATAFDAGDNASTAVTCTPASGSTFPLDDKAIYPNGRTTTVNCSSKDSKNNISNGSFTVTVKDTTGPVISGTPSNMTISAVNASGATVNYTAPTASDAVDGNRTVNCAPASGSTFALGQTTVICSASDTRDNSSESRFVIDVKDTTAPVLQLPGPIVAEATSAAGAAVSYIAAATDNVDGSITPSCNPVSSSTFAIGTASVTCSATDRAANSNSGSFVVTVQDTTAPALSLPASIFAEAANASGSTVTYSASASDVVDGQVTPSCSLASGSTFSIGTTSVTCSATDRHGNTASSSFNVDVRDSTAPRLHLPADQTLEATSSNGAVATYQVSADDTVDGALPVSCVDQANHPVSSEQVFPLGTTTVTCSARDAHNNWSRGSFTITVRDTTAPVLSLPTTPIVKEATGPQGAPVDFDATAQDTVNGTLNPSCKVSGVAVETGATFPLGITTVACSVADAAGNSVSGSFTVEVKDRTGPAIAESLGAIDAREARGGAYISYTTPAALDLVDGSVAVSCSPVSGSLFSLGTATVNCSATDSRGNNASRSYEILVQDANAPVLALPASFAREATGPNGAAVTYTASADDVVDGPITPLCIPGSGSTFSIGTTAVSCSARDASNNTSEGSFSITIQDTTKPDLTLPEDKVPEATGPNGAKVNFIVSATDIVDGARSVDCNFNSGTTFPLGKTTITCSATDTQGNKAEDSFTITVRDTIRPDLTLPANITLEATSPSGAEVPFDTSATDIVDGSITPTCSAVSGDTFRVGKTIVNCSAVDAHGNMAEGSFTIEVKDTTPPDLFLPKNFTEEATGPDGAPVMYEAYAYDIVDEAVLVQCNPSANTTFTLGATTVSCLASDSRGNKAQATFQVTVVDTTPPAINGELMDVEAEATGASGTQITYTSPSAYDLVDGTVRVNCEPPSGSTFAIGITNVTCSASDSRNNHHSRTFSVKIKDTTAPVLALPQDITKEATSGAGAQVSFTVSANDIVDGAVTPTCIPSSGATFAVGDTTVECSAADTRGNTATSSFKVSVADTTPPVLTMPENKTVEATSPNGAAVTYGAPTARDIVDGTITPRCDKVSGAIFRLGETIVTCSATDAHGNTSSDTFIVEVEDTTPPALSQPANITTEATSREGAAVSFDAPTATDIVDGMDSVTCAPASGTTFGLGDNTVTCSATDARNNRSEVRFTITVRDTTKPDLTVPADITAEASGPDGAAVVFTATASDIVDGELSPTCNPAPGTTFVLGTTTVECSVTDARDNTASAEFKVTVRDTTAPKIIGAVENPNAEATSGAGAVVTYSSPVAQDVVDGAVAVTCNPTSGSTFRLGTTTVTCSTTDAHGNTASEQYDITVKDSTSPMLSLPANIEAEATEPGGAAVSFTASASDIVDGPVDVTCTPASGTLFLLDMTTEVQCSTKDKQGNQNSRSFTIRVKDTTPPILEVPNNKTVEATDPSGAAVSYEAPSAKDVVDGAITPTCDKASETVFPLGQTTVTCTATDRHNNTSRASFTVTVKDTTAPAVSVPRDITVTSTSAKGAQVSYGASATDVVDGAIAPTCTPASGSLFAPGTTLVTCSATDKQNNTASKTFKVTVGFGWSGILQPVNRDGSSVFKLGSTIPVKFQLTGASAGITNGVFKLYYTKISNGVSGTELEATSTSAANIGNMFRYDPTGTLYIFNMNTKGLSAGTWRVRIDLGDGSINTVNISLKP